MSACVWQSCCRASDALGSIAVLTERDYEASCVRRFGDNLGPPVARRVFDDLAGQEGSFVAPAATPSFTKALHEIGHAAVCLANEVAVIRVTCSRCVHDNAPPQAGIEISLAGHVATQFGSRHIYRRFDGEWLADIARVRSGLAGRCDFCQAAAEALAGAPGASDAEIIALLRAAEGALIAFFERALRDGLWARFLRAADLLLERGELSGDAIAGILEIETAPANLRGRARAPLPKVALPAGVLNGCMGSRTTTRAPNPNFEVCL